MAASPRILLPWLLIGLGCGAAIENDCETGFMYNVQKDACEECPRGKYYNTEQGTFEYCENGHAAKPCWTRCLPVIPIAVTRMTEPQLEVARQDDGNIQLRVVLDTLPSEVFEVVALGEPLSYAIDVAETREALSVDSECRGLWQVGQNEALLQLSWDELSSSPCGLAVAGGEDGALLRRGVVGVYITSIGANGRERIEIMWAMPLTLHFAAETVASVEVAFGARVGFRMVVKHIVYDLLVDDDDAGSVGPSLRALFQDRTCGAACRAVSRRIPNRDCECELSPGSVRVDVSMKTPKDLDVSAVQAIVDAPSFQTNLQLEVTELVAGIENIGRVATGAISTQIDSVEVREVADHDPEEEAETQNGAVDQLHADSKSVSITKLVILICTLVCVLFLCVWVLHSHRKELQDTVSKVQKSSDGEIVADESGSKKAQWRSEERYAQPGGPGEASASSAPRAAWRHPQRPKAPQATSAASGAGAAAPAARLQPQGTGQAGAGCPEGGFDGVVEHANYVEHTDRDGLVLLQPTLLGASQAAPRALRPGLLAL